MHPIQELSFRGAKRVRVVGTADSPMFVAADVCSALGVTNVSVAVNGIATRGEEGLDADEKGICIVETPGGAQQLLCVTESGVYTLIFKSRRPEAKAFKKWVTSEVLPAIRKHGRYEIEQQAKHLAFQHFLTDVPSDWRRTFSDGWFEAILGVWGIDYVKAHTPSFIGKVINEYVYDALVEGLPDELKARRAECGQDSAKLHQFLATEAKTKLSEHLAVTKALALNCQNRPQDFRESFDRVFRGRNQLLLALNAQRGKRQLAA